MIMLKIAAIVAVIYVVIALIFQYSIAIRKLKPNKLSKLFYNDDENFNKF